MSGKVLGLTGGIGSGKSTVGEFLSRSAGWHRLDADDICRLLLRPGEPGWRGVSRVLGQEFFLPDRSLDRKKVREAIFSDPTLRGRINAVIHPLARDSVAAGIASWRQTAGREGGAVLVVEVPLLFEASWQDDFDAIVVVYADQSVCLSRIASRDGVSLESAEAALASQWPLADKSLAADYVIDNSGSRAGTCLQLLHLIRLVSENGKSAKKT